MTTGLKMNEERGKRKQQNKAVVACFVVMATHLSGWPLQTNGNFGIIDVPARASKQVPSRYKPEKVPLGVTSWVTAPQKCWFLCK